MTVELSPEHLEVSEESRKKIRASIARGPLRKLLESLESDTEHDSPDTPTADTTS